MRNPGPLEDLFVVVADDHAPVRESLAGLLRAHGYAVELFESGEGLLGFENLAGAGCAVLDVGLPGMTGLDLQRRLAEITWLVPVILISGHDHDTQVRHSALEAGALAFLRKPLDERVLLHAIRCAFSQPRARMTRRA